MDLGRLEEVPHEQLLCVVGLGGVAGGWSDALVLNIDDLSDVQVFVGGIAPVGSSDLHVQFLG